MAHTCRGTISLHGAHIHTEDSCNFIVSNGGGTQTFHLCASSEVERQRWVTALELAKAKAIQRMESEDDESIINDTDDVDITAEIDKGELTNVVKMLGSKLEDLQTCHDLIVKHGLALQRSLGEIENSHNNQDNRSSEHGSLVKAVNERATLFKITSNAMINASAEFIELCQVILILFWQQQQKSRQSATPSSIFTRALALRQKSELRSGRAPAEFSELRSGLRSG